jgi:hypothetical protein
VIISDMTVLLCGSSQTHLGTEMPSGGGHIIRAVTDDDGRLGHLAILPTTATAIRITNVAIVYFRMYAG